MEQLDRGPPPPLGSADRSPSPSRGGFEATPSSFPRKREPSETEENLGPRFRGDDEVRKGDDELGAVPTRATWPAADAIIGNPPFLGGKRLRTELGDESVDDLFAAYAGRVPQEADLVAYWVAKAWAAVTSGRATRVGLVTTNSIRGGANRRVLAPIADAGGFFAAWSDQPLRLAASIWSRYLSASSAAMQPVPAEVMA